MVSTIAIVATTVDAIVALIVVSPWSHLANHSTKDMPPKLKNWGKPQKEECIKQFNLFEPSHGTDGWDPCEVSNSTHTLGRM